ncbi:MAG: bifunctional oligoribonuclease/PAP phosphatase NrnA, partial [Halobacteriales archaeon]
MVRRLVLGFGAVGHAVLDGLLADRGELLVLEADEGRVESLRDENVPAQLADPIDAKTVSAACASVETVLVLGDDSTANRAAVDAAATAHPEALIVAYTGVHPDPADRAAMSSSADRLLDHGSAVADHLRQLLGTEPGSLVYGLRRTLRNIDGHLAIFTHDNPDPDAIASGVALRDLAAAVGVDATVCYFGEISHQENRAFVNLLDLELTQHEAAEFEAETYDAYALVDHTRPGVNDQLPPDLPIEIVIDHHPEREPVDVRFEDRRPELGATSTMLADYYRWLGIEPTGTVATALLYGIRVDTRDFGRELTEPDVEAAGYLLEWADTDVLEQVESPSMTADTFDTI